MLMERQHIDDRTQQEGFERKCAHYLERYFYLLLFNSYLSTQKLNDLDLTFTEWVKSKSEVATLINQLHSKPRQGLKIVLPHEVPAPRHEQTSHLGSSEDEIQQAIIDRVGDVLCTNTILKSDHFPGCQRKGSTSSRLIVICFDLSLL